MGPPKKIGVTGKACAPETTALPPPAPSAPAPTAAPAAACPRSALQHAYLMSNTRGWRELRSARRSPSLPALPRPPCVPRPPVVKLCRIQTIGADAERMQLRCTMRPSLLASPEGSGFACGPWLRGSDLHLTNRERVWGVIQVTLSTTAAASSLEPRAAAGGYAHTERGFCRQKLSPHDPTPYPSPQRESTSIQKKSSNTVKIWSPLICYKIKRHCKK